jgi:hypothetical protein
MTAKKTTAKSPGRGAAALAVFSFSLALSATLMFAVQPMAGKMLLPLVGGTPAGWIVAMAFFQVMLLGGYLVAHLLSALPPRPHGFCYILGLLAGAAFLPLSLSRGADAASVPGAAQVFGMLTLGLGVPFVALSATSSTLQRLFTTTDHRSSGDPYFLYVASNLGSFAGLLLYPLAIEPLMGLDAQARWFTAGYAALIGSAAICLAVARKGGKAARTGAIFALPGRRELEWLALAFIPACLLMSVTTYITTDIISAPLIWILPLGLYLVTFIIAFSKKPAVPLKTAEALHPYAVFLGIIGIAIFGGTFLATWNGVAFHLVIFFVIALVCHLRLAGLRPLDGSRDLTRFYLMMSLGGALAGLLNAFIFPNVFNSLIELPLTLLASFTLHRDFRAKSAPGKALMAVLLAILLLANLPSPNLGIDGAQGRYVLFMALLGAVPFLLLVYRKAFRPMNLALAAGAIFMISHFLFLQQNQILSARNFFGTIRVFDTAVSLNGKDETLRIMRHGSTLHGKQIVGGMLSRTPTAYYTREGPLGDIFRGFKPKKVAVMGLGAGATNCYAAPDREFTFFEIDPAVVKMAQEQFTFLRDCVSKKPPRILVGDGRLELAALDEKFDLIVIDVFTSDSIPTHIITEEAFRLYAERLAPRGVLAVHVSNRFFRLWDVVAATAGTQGFVTALRAHLSDDIPIYGSKSAWLAIMQPGVKGDLGKRGWLKVVPPPQTRRWTDNYTNLLETISWGQGKVF